jgi:hypothetical protein
MDFQNNNYVIIKNFIEQDFVEFIQDYFSMKINSDNYDKCKNNYENNYCWYGDHLTETILQNSCESLGSIIKKQIIPTYSFTSFRMKGDISKKYEYKESHEISSILTLGTSESNSRIIYLTKDKQNFNPSNSIQLSLDPGDLCMYNGHDLHYWEPKLENTWSLQVFFYFVDNNGPYKNFIYDNRSYLGFFSREKL